MPAPRVIDHLSLLPRLQDAFEAEIDSTPPDAVVPACGDWRASELVLHLAGVHRWAAGMVRGEKVSDVVDPAGRDLRTVYSECAAELRAALAATPADTTCWTLDGDGPVSFWHRRQVHETLVHLHDLRAAGLGSGEAAATEQPRVTVPGDADQGWGDVWADAVDEVVTMFQPRQVRLGRMTPLARTVRLVASDVGRTWDLGGDRGAAGTDVGTITAPARGLALLLWGRLTPAEAGAELDGDDEGLRAVHGALAAPIVP